MTRLNEIRLLATLLTTLSPSRFLHNTITTHITPWPTLLPTLLRNLRIALFPYNARGPAAPSPPSADEQLKIRRRAAEALLSLVPRQVGRIFFATGDLNNNSRSSSRRKRNEEEKESGEVGDEETEEMISQVEEILDVFGNAYLNKHLIYNVLELVLVRLAPEMAEKTPGELLAERGIVVGGSGPGPDQGG
jgi:hypothetical protein